MALTNIFPIKEKDIVSSGIGYIEIWPEKYPIGCQVKISKDSAGKTIIWQHTITKEDYIKRYYVEVTPATYYVNCVGSNVYYVGLPKLMGFQCLEYEYTVCPYVEAIDGHIYTLASPLSTNITVHVAQAISSYDLCLIGGGGAGGYVSGDGGSFGTCGGGGAGGYMENVYGLTEKSFTCQVGAGGTGTNSNVTNAGTTSCSLGYSAKGGGNGSTSGGTHGGGIGGSGGTGGGAGGKVNYDGGGNGGTNGGNGGKKTAGKAGTGDGKDKHAFGIQSDAYLYCGGGGGWWQGVGGAGGGGTASTYENEGIVSASRYGAGGGGCAYGNGSGNKGYQGAILIRVHI